MSGIKFPVARTILAAAIVVVAPATWAQPAISGKRIFIKDTSSLALWSLD